MPGKYVPPKQILDAISEINPHALKQIMIDGGTIDNVGTRSARELEALREMHYPPFCMVLVSCLFRRSKSGILILNSSLTL